MVGGYVKGTAGLVLAVLTGVASAQSPVPSTAVATNVPLGPLSPLPVFPKVAAAVASCHQGVPVPPTLEIEVLDPNVDARGNPTGVLRPAPVITANGPEGRLLVDIPPTVLIHRYYYTGDRTFQASVFPGGPCIVVVNHPHTGERLYIPVQMLPGAPRVTYSSGGIDYDFGKQGISIEFCCLHDRPKVVYREGVPFGQRVGNAVTHTTQATRRLIDRTGLPDLHDRMVSGTKNVVETTLDRANEVGKRLCEPPRALLANTPLGGVFTSSPEERAAKARDAQLQRVQDAASRQDIYVPTNR